MKINVPRSLVPWTVMGVFKGVKVGLDCANGSSWNIAKSVFDALGADTYAENYKKDPEGYEKIITTFIKERVP